MDDDMREELDDHIRGEVARMKRREARRIRADGEVLMMELRRKADELSVGALPAERAQVEAIFQAAVEAKVRLVAELMESFK